MLRALKHSFNTRKRVDAAPDLQEIELTVCDQDGATSGPSKFSCTANVKEGAPRTYVSDSNSTFHEYITADMFKAFLDSHNKQMEFVKTSIDSLNNSFYEDISEEEEEDSYESEEEVERPRKRQRTHEVSPSPSRPVSSSARVTDQLGGNDVSTKAVPIARDTDQLGGNDVCSVNNHGVVDSFVDILDKKINEFSSEEKKGPNVRDNLAKMINSLLSSPMDGNKKNELFEKYLRPGNCNMNYPRVNDVIWDLCISSFGRSLDVKLHTIQRLLLKGLVPVVSVIDKLLDKSGKQPSTADILESLLDSVAMLTSTSYSMSMYRRMNIKQYLNEQYHTLCSLQTQKKEM